VHHSLWKGNTNIFFDEKGYSLLSQTVLHYIGGLLTHAPALLALAAPTTNSYRRAGAGLRGARQPGVFLSQFHSLQTSV
jgi:glutamine synthetase